jgi:hypothetical protein
VILIQVAVAAIVLCAFCGLAVDYGVLWVARAQAQNAADAAALAGATALAFDSVVDYTVAQQTALAVAAQNNVWLQAPQPPFVTAVATNDASCVVPGTPPPPGGFQFYNCITVTVNRNQPGANRLPTFFTQLVGVPDQGVQAQAKGTAAPANSTNCLWPLAIPDRWTGFGTATNPITGEVTPLAWSPTATPPRKFLKYGEYPIETTPNNTYTPPSNGAAGTGYRMLQTTLNTNQVLTLTRLAPGLFADSTPYAGILTANHFIPVVVPRSDGGSFASNLASCNGLPVYIGDTLDPDNGGGLDVQAATAAEALRAQDAGATWSLTAFRIRNSCAASNPPCAMQSPRLVVLPLFDVDLFESTRRTAGGPQIRIVNFAGFFIDDVPTASSIRGYLATYPGTIDTTRPQVPYLSAFLRAGVLFR